MALTRRRFLSNTGALAGLTLVGPNALSAAHQPVVHQRKDVAKLTESSPDIASLKLAINRMKRGEGLDPGDHRHWLAQAEIHGKLLGGSTNCQHGNWYFLPWHRAYLYFFEEIVRELSRNEEFSPLPYWDWTKDRTLPEMFWGDDNPLHNPPRPGSPDSGREAGLKPDTPIPPDDFDRLMGKRAISDILATNDFQTIGGLAVDRLGQFAGEGSLQNGPHNYIHNFVGGDMASGGSPFDPIFWLHHCNVDRLWVEWAVLHPDSTPGDKDWLDTPIKHFYNRAGKPETITVQKTINTSELHYVYDRHPMTLVTNAQAQPRVQFAPLGFRHTDTLSFLSHANPELADAISESTRDSELQRRQTIRLRISGIEPPKDPATVLDVFLNCEKLNLETSIDDPSYVGSCTFFLHGRQDHSHDGRGLTFVLDLSRDFARLYGDRPLAADEPLKISVIARPLTLNDSRRSPSPGQVQNLNPQQVYIEVVRA